MFVISNEKLGLSNTQIKHISKSLYLIIDMLSIKTNRLITKSRKTLLELSFQYKVRHHSKETREQFPLRQSLLEWAKENKAIISVSYYTLLECLNQQMKE